MTSFLVDLDRLSETDSQPIKHAVRTGSKAGVPQQAIIAPTYLYISGETSCLAKIARQGTPDQRRPHASAK